MINRFASELTVTRETPGTYVNGYYRNVSTQTFTIMATVEPLDGNDLLMLSEGERSKEAIRIYTPSELFTVDTARMRNADFVTYRGKKFQVHSVKTWTQLIPHFQVVAVDKTDLTEED